MAMAVANIIITDVTLNPNPVQTGKQVIISVGINQRWFGLATAAGRMIKRANGEVIATKKEKG